MADEPQAPDDWTAPPEPPAAPVPQLETVDERLTKLEVAVAALTDPSRLSQYAPDAPSGMAPAALMQAVLPTLVGKAVDAAAPAAPEAASFWGRFGVLRELHLMFRMYVDNRYRLSRLCQFAAPALLALMVLNYLLFEFWQIPIVSYVFPLIERLILIVLAVALYKVLAREAARYAAVVDYLAQYGR
jgi:hypothetical protein